jgi:hypothetical protein
MISQEDRNRYSDFFHDRVRESVPKAVAAELQKHKQKGVAIVVWRDGRIVEIPPDKISTHQKTLEK